MIQKSLNEENQEINDKAYEIYEKDGSKDGKDWKNWLEAERQLGRKPPLHMVTTNAFRLFSGMQRPAAFTVAGLCID